MQRSLTFITDDLEKKNYTKSVKWLKKAALQGNLNAQYDLAELYYDGKVVSQNYAQAFKLFKRVAGAGYVPAQKFLALMYLSGKGTEKNIEEALYLYEEAAKQGYKYAANTLAELYYFGRIIPKDRLLAYKWFSIASEYLLKAYNNTLKMQWDMSAEQIAQGRSMAGEWLVKYRPNYKLRAAVETSND